MPLYHVQICVTPMAVKTQTISSPQRTRVCGPFRAIPHLFLQPSASLGVKVTQSCPVLCDPMDCSLPCSSVRGIFQARVLEWAAIFFSRYLPNPGIEQGCPALQTCCRKGDPFQGPKLDSCLTLGNELSEETHVLTKQEILLGKGPGWRVVG